MGRRETGNKRRTSSQKRDCRNEIKSFVSYDENNRVGNDNDYQLF